MGLLNPIIEAVTSGNQQWRHFLLLFFGCIVLAAIAQRH